MEAHAVISIPKDWSNVSFLASEPHAAHEYLHFYKEIEQRIAMSCGIPKAVTIPAHKLFPVTPKREVIHKEVFSLAAHVRIDLESELGVLYRWKQSKQRGGYKLNASMEVIPTPQLPFDVDAYVKEAKHILEELKGHVRTKTLRKMRCKLKGMAACIEKLKAELNG